jgi:hypothetical protein
LVALVALLSAVLAALHNPKEVPLESAASILVSVLISTVLVVLEPGISLPGQILALLVSYTSLGFGAFTLLVDLISVESSSRWLTIYAGFGTAGLLGLSIAGVLFYAHARREHQFKSHSSAEQAGSRYSSIQLFLFGPYGMLHREMHTQDSERDAMSSAQHQDSDKTRAEKSAPPAQSPGAIHSTRVSCFNIGRAVADMASYGGADWQLSLIIAEGITRYMDAAWVRTPIGGALLSGLPKQPGNLQPPIKPATAEIGEESGTPGLVSLQEFMLLCRKVYREYFPTAALPQCMYSRMSLFYQLKALGYDVAFEAELDESYEWIFLKDRSALIEMARYRTRL